MFVATFPSKKFQTNLNKKRLLVSNIVENSFSFWRDLAMLWNYHFHHCIPRVFQFLSSLDKELISNKSYFSVTNQCNLPLLKIK